MYQCYDCINLITADTFPFIQLGAATVISLPTINDGISGPINVPGGFSIGNTYQTTVYVRYVILGYVHVTYSIRQAKQLVKVICTLTYWTKPKILQWLWQLHTQEAV